MILLFFYDPPCGTMVHNTSDDKNDINVIDDPFPHSDEKSFFVDSSDIYIVDFASNTCNYCEIKGNNIPLYVPTIYKNASLCFICIGYHKVVVIYSCTKCQYI